MKFLKKLILLLIFLSFISHKIFAQGTYTGCLYNNIVYTANASGSQYNSNSGLQPLSANYCSWTPNTGTSCTICFDNNGRYNGGNCMGGSTNERTGIYNTFTMVLCPLDNEIYILFGFLAALFILQFRSRKLVI